MTGFGRATREQNGSRAMAEITSVNSKGLDLRVVLPPDVSTLEPEIRALVSQRVSRGSMSVTVILDLSPELRCRRLFFDMDLAEAVGKRLRKLAAAAGIEGRPGLADVLNIPGVVTDQAVEGLTGELRPLVLEAVGAALDALREMQRAEGKTLAEALQASVARMNEVVQRIEGMTDDILQRWRRRLEERIRQFAPDVEVDDERLAREVVFFAERSDVTEELVRIRSHLQQFSDALRQETPVGRILGFIVQELGREINTLAAKCRDAGMAGEILNLRREFGSVREQIANVE